MAIKTLQQVALDECQNNTELKNIIIKDFYVDDLLTGANDEMSAIMIQRRMTETLQKGGFKIRKWSSNAKNVLKAIPENER